MISIARPSRRVRASATAMRYWGLRILPSRVSLILTAMVERFSCDCHAAIQRSRAGCPDPVLPYVCDRRAAMVARQTAAHCARKAATGKNRGSALVRALSLVRDTPGEAYRSARSRSRHRSDQLVEALLLDPLAH